MVTVKEVGYEYVFVSSCLAFIVRVVLAIGLDRTGAVAVNMVGGTAF